MTTKIKDYSLRFYIRDLYLRRAGIRGGSMFDPETKKAFKLFSLRVKCAINQPKKVLESLAEKFPISSN